MLARSFVRDLAGALAAVVAIAACNSNHKPEADPGRLVPLVKTIDKNTPTPGAAPTCTPEQMVGGATMTQVSLLKIEGEPANPGAEREDWINPPELDSPAVREVIDPATDETTKRQAAYELLSAPFYLVYRIDIVDAPMAIGVKDLKRGTVGARVLRFDRDGELVCIKVLTFQNTLAKSDWAILKSNLAVMDPKIAAALRDDLRSELLKHVRALGRPDS
jgi:hypothetical protein